MWLANEEVIQKLPAYFKLLFLLLAISDVKDDILNPLKPEL